MKLINFKCRVVFFLSICFLTSCEVISGNYERERVLFDKIEKGMTQAEVEKILGKPDYSDKAMRNNEVYQYFFTDSKSALRSEMPYVRFDSLGRVVMASYGEGY